jgi:hypothetical protein
MFSRAHFALSVFLMLICSLSHAKEISYQQEVQPILAEKCVACHACYDSPCQLNLGSGEGIARGANQLPVYNGARTHAQDTTRLYLDAHGESEWREKGFYSVLERQQGQAALLSRMLELGHRAPLKPHAKLPADLDIRIDRENQCPRPDQFDAFEKKFAQVGMPFAVTGLDKGEYQTLQDWVKQGARVEEQPLQPSAREQRQLEKWEAMLNAPGAREELVNRWLFEHLFLAHLYFEDGESDHFFQLVRSRTPSGQPIDVISTRRPNEDPGARFFYRLWPIQGVIVHKTHITYPLSAEKMARIKELFYSGSWQADRIPGYGAHRRANPFETFAAIPAQARYQFMLDNAEYFVRTFIRGPVCRGQIATDVIRDNFWALFQSPEHDLYLTDPAYRNRVTPLLSLPGQFDDIPAMLSRWHSYRDLRNEYRRLRVDAYGKAPAPSWSHIWTGNDNAFLSIFRQHDSASVRKGLIGTVPQTIWWMDYPLFERTYYQLVVNFDVFGNVSHQAQTRLYFDLIRNGAEMNFLRLMPVSTRAAMIDDWYQSSGKLKMWVDYENVADNSRTNLALNEADPKGALLQGLLQRYGYLNARPDPFSRCDGAYCSRPDVPSEVQDAEQALSRLTIRPAAGLKVIQHLPEASMLRVEWVDGRREIYSLLRNRAHSNVAFMLGEEKRYQLGLDTLTLYPGVLSSYPNFIFNIQAPEIPEFVRAMEQAQDAAAFEAITDRWGIRRSHPQFWFYFHDLTRYIQETQPREAGVLDMNRYENL